MATVPISLKGRALRYLAGREHSRAELVRKLAPHEEEPGQIERVLDDLQAKDFISEARVVASVINRRAASLGGARLRQELQAKGIDAQRVRDAVEQLKDTELERAQ
ncbi:MAG: RecX family transcriptional regulator, partial [Giesbergeria sp.]|nr:RecX family transcriptional regulator [Giesbergeria sp.]